MVQTFQLIAPQARMHIHWRCIVEDMLFGRYAMRLVNLLAVPIRPPNLAVYKAILPQTIEPQDGTGGKTSPKKKQVEGYTEQDSKSNVLANYSQHPRVVGSKYGYRNDKVDTNHGVTLSNLPTELHCLIFSQFEHIGDSLCFALTNRHYWTIGRHYIHDYHESTLGQWAGKNIMFRGEYTKPGDYPPGLLSTEQSEQMRLIATRMPNSVMNHYFFAVSCFSQSENWSCGPKGEFSIRYIPKERSLLNDPMFKLVQNEIYVDRTTYFPRDQSWILRNLTTKEFVRAESIARSPECIHGPDIDLLGFGHVVIARICWSTSPDIGFEDTTNISRGVWAGHCFDITTIARHEADTKGGEDQWRDVGKEVADELLVLRENHEKRLLVRMRRTSRVHS